MLFFPRGEKISRYTGIIPSTFVANRQTVLFSATQTQKITTITSLAIKKEPIYVGIDDDKEIATVDGLQQGYAVCPSELRFLFLYSFLKKNRTKKIMVFFSSCMSVKYHDELLNYIDVPVMSIHVRYRVFFHKNARTTFLKLGITNGFLVPLVDRVGRSRRNGPRPFFNFAILPPVSCFAPT